MKDLKSFVRKGILDIKPYPTHKPFEELQQDMGLELALMSTNENPLGPSPKALEAIQKELNTINRYPDSRCTFLVREMAERLKVTEEKISIANGADNCISIVIGAFINPGDEVIVGSPSFPIYDTGVQAVGGSVVQVPLKNHLYDLEAVQKKIGPRTKMVVICNPNNPTGSIVPKEELDAFVEVLPPHVLLNLDEAYFEFVDDEQYPDGLEYIRQGHNVIVIRTFSKIFGIAGLRIGYSVACEEFISALNRVREVFPVSRLAQAAALAALGDEAFKQRVLANNEAGKKLLCRTFDRLGLPYIPSHTNFVFVDLRADAKKAGEELLKRGIMIKPGPTWGSPSYARVSIGTMEQNELFCSALPEVLAQAD